MCRVYLKAQGRVCLCRVWREYGVGHAARPGGSYECHALPPLRPCPLPCLSPPHATPHQELHSLAEQCGYSQKELNELFLAADKVHFKGL